MRRHRRGDRRRRRARGRRAARRSRGHARLRDTARRSSARRSSSSVAEPGRARRARRSCGRGSGPSSRGPRLADAGHSFQTFPSPMPRAPVALRKSTTSCASLDESRVVDRRVRGDDHDAVVAPRARAATEREAVLVRARGRAGRGRRRPRRRCASSSISFSAGDSRMSPMSALYATPSTRILRARERALRAVVERLRDHASGRSTACSR